MGIYEIEKTINENTYVIQNLSFDTKYYFKVSASINNLGESNLSFPVSIIIVDLPKPIGLTATTISDTSINISWLNIPDATGYKIYRALSSSGLYTLVGNTTDTNYTDIELNTGTTYFYKIAGVKNEGEGPSSDFVSTFTPISIPVGLQGIVQSMNSIILSWNTVHNANEYLIYRSLTHEGDYNLIGSTSNLNYTDTGISQLTNYYYKVSAKNANGEGEKSEYIRVAIEPPSPPENITYTVLSSSSIKLDWDIVLGASSYKIYRSSGGEYSLVGTVTTNTFTNTGLSRNLNYYYRITSLNIAGESEYSTQINVIIQSPPSPSNVKAMPESSSSIRISWDKVNDATLYEIYKRGSSGFSRIDTTVNLYYIDSNLTIGHERSYEYRIRAVNSIGTSNDSVTVTSYVLPISLSRSMWFTHQFSYNWYQGVNNSPHCYSFPVSGEDVTIRLERVSGEGSASMTIMWKANNSV